MKKSWSTDKGPLLTFPVFTSKVSEGPFRGGGKISKKTNRQAPTGLCSPLLKNKSVHLFCGDKENLVYKHTLVSGFLKNLKRRKGNN